MRMLVSALALGGALLALVASTATASTHGQLACSAKDKAGNWEVVIGGATTAKAAGTIRTRATAKRLHATVERDGCAKRWEVVVTDSSKTKAGATVKTAQKDGFAAATVEKS